MVTFDHGQSLAAADIRKQRKDDTLEYYAVDLMPLSDSMQKRAVYSMSKPLATSMSSNPTLPKSNGYMYIYI